MYNVNLCIPNGPEIIHDSDTFIIHGSIHLCIPNGLEIIRVI